MDQTLRIWKRPIKTLQPMMNFCLLTESGANPSGTPASDLTTPAPQPGTDPGEGENAIPNQEEDVDSTLVHPVRPVIKLGIPNPAEEAQSCPTAMPTTSTVSGGDASANPVPSGSNVSPGFPVPAGTPNPDAAQLGPSSIEALVADKTIADLAQSLAIGQAGGNPQAGAFSSVMTGLREACGLMFQGFQEACLGVEVVVQKTILEATAQDRAFTAKAAKGLDLWTAAL